eukprot:COSAG01_NODE_45768_length_406_cov_1.169381_1_plen_44_part_10
MQQLPAQANKLLLVCSERRVLSSMARRRLHGYIDRSCPGSRRAI